MSENQNPTLNVPLAICRTADRIGQLLFRPEEWQVLRQAVKRHVEAWHQAQVEILAKTSAYAAKASHVSRTRKP